jgi:uncharacterized protein (DUF2252 family)
MRHLATSLRSRDDDAAVEVLDAAYWMKGCSSLGLLRYAVLLGVGSGKKRDMALMDIKQAVTAAAPRYKATRSRRTRPSGSSRAPCICRLISASAWWRGISMGIRCSSAN